MKLNSAVEPVATNGVLNWLATAAVAMVAAIVEYVITDDVGPIVAVVGVLTKLGADYVERRATRAVVWAPDSVERLVRQRFGVDIGTALKQFGVEKVMQDIRDAAVAELDMDEEAADAAIREGLTLAGSSRAN